MSDRTGQARQGGQNVKVVRASGENSLYLSTRDEFAETAAKIYVNERGTPMNRARRKRVTSVFEIGADNLSEVYTAEDDPHDWGRSMGITIAEITIAPDGSLERDVIVESDANAALAPYPAEAFAAFGRGVNELLSAWGIM